MGTFGRLVSCLRALRRRREGASIFSWGSRDGDRSMGFWFVRACAKGTAARLVRSFVLIAAWQIGARLVRARTFFMRRRTAPRGVHALARSLVHVLPSAAPSPGGGGGVCKRELVAPRDSSPPVSGCPRDLAEVLESRNRRVGYVWDTLGKGRANVLNVRVWGRMAVSCRTAGEAARRAGYTWVWFEGVRVTCAGRCGLSCGVLRWCRLGPAPWPVL